MGILNSRTNVASNQVSNACAFLSSLVYHGETKIFTFEKYIALHTEQHNIINSLKETPEGTIDGLAKVQLIYDGILDPKLESVKSQLFANEEITDVILRIPLLCANK